MQIFNNHYNVADLIEVNRVTKDEILNLGFEGRVPISVWADNVFVWPVHYSQRTKKYRQMVRDSRPCVGEWLYVKPSYLRKFKSDEGAVYVTMTLFRSEPKASVDISASRFPGRTAYMRHGLGISMDQLWVPTDSWDLIEEEARNESENVVTFGIARRVYADILAAHDKNPALPHPVKCSYGLVYAHLARQDAPPGKNAGYWVNDSKRNPDEVSRKSGLGTLVILHRPEGVEQPMDTLETGFREFMNSFNEIKRQ